MPEPGVPSGAASPLRTALRAKPWQAIRPLEWLVLAFHAFVLLMAGPRAFAAWPRFVGGRAFTVLITLAAIGLWLLARRYRALAWPARTTAVSRLHWLAFPIALAPLALGVLFVCSGNSIVRQELFDQPVALILPEVATVSAYVLGFGLPSLMLWLALGLDIKRRGRLELLPFAGACARDLATALRDCLPLALAILSYAWMAAVIQLRHGEGKDPWMQAADRLLFAGKDPLDLLEHVIWRPLTEWLAFSYSFYAVLYPLGCGAALLKSGRAGLREISFAIGSSLLVAYVLYLLVPVEGPVLSRSFQVPLDMYLVAGVKAAMMDATRITWDCFPSMHTCCTVIFGWAAWRHSRRLFWFISPMALSMPLACVYLRYHYVVDVLAGLALAALAIAVTGRLRSLLVADLPAERLEQAGGEATSPPR